MSKVVAIMSMSLDGFVADPNDGVAEVFDWYMPAATAATEPVSALWPIPITVDDFRRLTAPDLLPHLPYLIALTLAAVITWRMVAALGSRRSTT